MRRVVDVHKAVIATLLAGNVKNPGCGWMVARGKEFRQGSDLSESLETSLAPRVRVRPLDVHSITLEHVFHSNEIMPAVLPPMADAPISRQPTFSAGEIKEHSRR
jgi:hypothetical protein